MAKKINFSYEGKDYTLEYTRATVKQMEDSGFDIQAVGERPYTMIMALFSGAFRANHKFIKRDKVEEIYKNMPNKELLIEKLVEMYNEPLETLMEEPEDSAKKVTWEVSF